MPEPKKEIRRAEYQNVGYQNIRLPGSIEGKRVIKPDVLIS
jgi:hypothetical protein